MLSVCYCHHWNQLINNLFRNTLRILLPWNGLVRYLCFHSILLCSLIMRRILNFLLTGITSVGILFKIHFFCRLWSILGIIWRNLLAKLRSVLNLYLHLLVLIQNWGYPYFNRFRFCFGFNFLCWFFIFCNFLYRKSLRFFKNSILDLNILGLLWMFIDTMMWLFRKIFLL